MPDFTDPTVQIAALPRVFRLGSMRLTDPDPTLPPEAALRLYAPNYPHLATAILSGPLAENGTLVWTVEKPLVKTKG